MNEHELLIKFFVIIIILKIPIHIFIYNVHITVKEYTFVGFFYVTVSLALEF